MKQLVAIGDILGFKNTIRTTPLEHVVSNYLLFFRKAMEHAMQAKGWPDPPRDFASLRAQSVLGIEWFSDTIVLYTKEDTDDAAIKLIQVVNWLLFETFYNPATRLRFGIDYGELNADTNAGQIVGNAVVAAHELEANQQWMGGALTTAALDRLPIDARHYTVTYPVPVKQHSPGSTTAMNWTQGVHYALVVPFAPDRTRPAPEDDPSIVAKWQNTLQFHDTVCKTCRRMGTS